jgi:hypothetical protein
MTHLRFALLADGTSDRRLLPILEWVLRQQLPTVAIIPEWADLGRLKRPPTRLAERMAKAIELYPSDVLFVHRDAERASWSERAGEIRSAADALALSTTVPVVPVRMTEAWLLLDEAAIRTAAGNPNGKSPLALPRPRSIEKLPDPKALLLDLLRAASELTGRRRKQFDAAAAGRRIVEQTTDFTRLRQLPAFCALEGDVRQVCHDRGWDQPDEQS